MHQRVPWERGEGVGVVMRCQCQWRLVAAGQERTGEAVPEGGEGGQ